MSKIYHFSKYIKEKEKVTFSRDDLNSIISIYSKNVSRSRYTSCLLYGFAGGAGVSHMFPAPETPNVIQHEGTALYFAYSLEARKV